MKIGMRTLKTALAVFFCVVAARLLRLEYPFFAAVAAIITMENTVSNSFKAGKNRVLGTMIGAGVGFICALISPENPVLCGLGIIVVIYLCNLLKWNGAISIAGIVFMAIMVNLNGKSPSMYSISRIVDTFVGVSIAVLVNYFILPPNPVRRLLAKNLIFVENYLDPIGENISNLNSIEVNCIAGELKDLNRQLNNIENDFVIRKKNIDEIGCIKEVLNLSNKVLNHLILLQDLRGREDIEDSSITTVSDYHNRELLNKLEQIKPLVAQMKEKCC